MTDKIEKLANDEIAVIVWPFGAGQKQIGLCFDDEERPAAIFALAEQRAFMLREAIFGTALRAEVASLRQQLDEARAVGLTIAEQRHAAEADRDLLFSELAEARRELRDGLSDRDLLTDVPPDQLVDEVLALIDRGYQQYTELRSLNVDLLADNARLLVVYRAAAEALRAWTVYLPRGFQDDYRWKPVQRFLDLDLDSYRAGATWTEARPGDTPGKLVPGEGEAPQPICADGVPVDSDEVWEWRLRSLKQAIMDQAPVWDETFPEGNTGFAVGVADAAVVALRWFDFQPIVAEAPDGERA